MQSSPLLKFVLALKYESLCNDFLEICYGKYLPQVVEGRLALQTVCA